MDAISKAIEKRIHVSARENINRQEWEQFEEDIRGKKLFLFGAGGGATYFWIRYKGDMPIAGVIDNAKRKQGLGVEEVVTGAVGTDRMKISDISILKKYNPEDVVVLITNLNFYEDIIQQLDDIGVKNYYVMLVMEANRRAKFPGIDYDKENLEYRRFYANIYCNFPVCFKKIVFYSFGSYADHGKYITEQLLKIRKDLDIVWLVQDMQLVVPQGVRLVDITNPKKYFYEMETAYIWIYNTVVPEYVIKRPEQVFIETKHWASITLKKFYLDASTITDIPQKVALWKYNSQCIDYIITGSDFDTISCRRGFEFNKNVIQVGSPRTDAMFREKEMKAKVYKHYGMEKDAKVLLYAPTYRYKKDEKEHIAEIRNIDIDYDKIKQVLEEQYGGMWCILIRLHPGQEKEIEKVKLPEYVIDASTYSDGQELVAACDILITDYSSIMFEPAFVSKPVFLFATDRDEYIDKEYDLLIDFDTLPFPIAVTNEELIQNFKNFEQEGYKNKVETFLKEYGIHEDGCASNRAAKFISGIIDRREGGLICH